jgi:hypothetical protein
MNRSFRRLVLPALSACVALAVRLTGADAPTPVPTAAAKPAAIAPAAAPAVAPKVAPLLLPKQLEGVITQEEFETYIKFQQEMRENPDIKAINNQIREKRIEMIDLQKKSQAAVQAQIDAHPDIKVITDKIKAHNNARPPMSVAPSTGPVPATHAVAAPPVATPVAASPTPVAK